MPVCKVTIYKRVVGGTGEEWTNVYNVNALGPNDAAGIGDSIMAAEQNISPDFISFYRITASLASGGPSVVVPKSDTGNRGSLDVNNLLPLFNTVRVTLGDGQNRPEVKYLRGIMVEADIAGPNLSSETFIDVTDNYAEVLPTILGLCGPSGEPIVTATVQLAVQMRQLGWHRATRPGFHRGWVPD